MSSEDFQFDNLIIMDINKSVLKRPTLTAINANKITVINHNIFEKNNIVNLDKVESVGLNYVLHCVPGKLNTSLAKSIILLILTIQKLLT